MAPRNSNAYSTKTRKESLTISARTGFWQKQKQKTHTSSDIHENSSKLTIFASSVCDISIPRTTGTIRPHARHHALCTCMMPGVFPFPPTPRHVPAWNSLSCGMRMWGDLIQRYIHCSSTFIELSDIPIALRLSRTRRQENQARFYILSRLWLRWASRLSISQLPIIISVRYRTQKKKSIRYIYIYILYI